MKLQYNGEIRKFSLDKKSVDFKTLQLLVEMTFPETKKNSCPPNIRFQDVEGDFISVTNDVEFEYARSEMPNALKFVISDNLVSKTRVDGPNKPQISQTWVQAPEVPSQGWVPLTSSRVEEIGTNEDPERTISRAEDIATNEDRERPFEKMAKFLVDNNFPLAEDLEDIPIKDWAAIAQGLIKDVADDFEGIEDVVLEQEQLFLDWITGLLKECETKTTLKWKNTIVEYMIKLRAMKQENTALKNQSYDCKLENSYDHDAECVNCKRPITKYLWCCYSCSEATFCSKCVDQHNSSHIVLRIPNQESALVSVEPHDDDGSCLIRQDECTQSDNPLIQCWKFVNRSPVDIEAGELSVIPLVDSSQGFTVLPIGHIDSGSTFSVVVALRRSVPIHTSMTLTLHHSILGNIGPQFGFHYKVTAVGTDLDSDSEVEEDDELRFERGVQRSLEDHEECLLKGLEQLAIMGFNDQEVCGRILVDCNFDISAAMAELLDWNA